MQTENTNLPPEIIHRITDPLARFLRIEAAAGAILLLATVVAVTATNSIWSEPFLGFWEMRIGFYIGPLDIGRSLRRWITDGLMTVFFFVVALELKRELVLGELRSLRMAALPLAGALGGMLFRPRPGAGGNSELKREGKSPRWKLRDNHLLTEDNPYASQTRRIG